MNGFGGVAPCWSVQAAGLSMPRLCAFPTQPYPTLHKHALQAPGTPTRDILEFKQNPLKGGDCALTAALKESYVNWISEGLVWVKPIRLDSQAKVFSGLSQSDSRYWHDSGPVLKTRRGASELRVTPWPVALPRAPC